ncbi:exopolysaccharide biosynthesis polyprenyl glycosylphosphotransferase [Chitinivibrio alkaliphilus]|uniref:Undecaprenyl-phosphate glucose phosphotransferase n=1 Tax=Chitinivibrio alkaliphilus ACht1 TaxID=1313304 RepID=U7D630_9BACT|nr:exopolysaccharide biosynthesis polyprenyl glycosylphosphotransferase [Chitinivibrio alkaliphilus]ERP31393.1 Undecaprenyl-phosphate glucose phosphotransferase [Chitinivibrio alkaliphilus ACht1]
MKTILHAYRYAYKSADILLLGFTFFFSIYFRFGACSFTTAEKLFLAYSLLVWIAVTTHLRYYAPSFQPGLRFRLSKTIKLLILFWLLLWSGAFLVKDIPYSRLQISLFALLQATLSFLVRGGINGILRRITRTSHRGINVVVVGAGPLGEKIAEELSLYPQLGRTCIGFIDHERSGSHILGNFTNAETIFTEHCIDEIIIATPLKYKDAVRNLITAAEDTGIRVHFTTDFSRWYDIPVQVNYIGTMPLLTLRDLPLDSLHNQCMKRGMDIFGALLGMILLSPLLIVLSISIKATSSGPILFTQTRTGYKNRDFACYKFRSMRQKNSPGDESDEEREQRKTALGLLMRKTNLDELPQLLNVLKGDMSLVGPRPHMLADTDNFRSQVSDYMRRHFIKPGITGWAQVNGYRGHVKTHSHIHKRVEFDLYYLENWSLFMDIKIILKTLFSKQSRLNAY